MPGTRPVRWSSRRRAKRFQGNLASTSRPITPWDRFFSTPVAGTPTGLAAAVGDGQAILDSWNPPVNATNYNVKRAVNIGGPYVVVVSPT